MAEPKSSLLGPGHQIGPYAIVSELGTGGGGTVYKATDPAGTTVALKVLHEHLSKSPTARARIAREVRLATDLRSPFTVKVLDADTVAERPWMAMEFVEGSTLEQTMPLERVEARETGAALLKALESMHAAGVVHRDLKPSNVIMAPDGPVLIDFGVAADNKATRLTATGQVLGTVAYMAPEQVLGEEVTEATDMWAWGSLMAATTSEGAVPFGDGNTHSTMRRIIDEPPDLSGVPDWIRPICEACLQKDPEDRCTVDEAKQLLDARFNEVAHNLVSTLRGHATGETANARSSPRTKAMMALGGMAIIGAIGFGASSLAGDSEQDPEVLDNTAEAESTSDASSAGQSNEQSTDAAEIAEAAQVLETGCASGDSPSSQQRVNRLEYEQLGGLRIEDSSVPVSCRQVKTLAGHTSTVHTLDELPDGRLLSGGWETTLRLWDPDASEASTSLLAHEHPIKATVVIEDQSLVASSDEEGTIHLWSLADTSDPIATIDIGSEIFSLALLEGNRLAAGIESEIRIYSLPNLEEITRRTDHKGRIQAVAQLPDGHIVTGSTNNTIRVWSQEMVHLQTVPTSSSINDLLAVDNGSFAAAQVDVDTINIWNIAEVTRSPNGAPNIELVSKSATGFEDLALLDDGRVAAAGKDRTVRIWDTEEPENPDTLYGHLGTINKITVMQNGDIASGGVDKLIRIFDPDAVEVPAVDEPHQAAVLDTVHLQDGRVASAGEEGIVKVWDPSDLSSPVEVLENTNLRGLRRITQTTSGGLVSGGYDRFLKLWPKAEGEGFGPPSLGSVQHGSTINTVLSLTNDRVLSGDSSGQMLLWNLAGADSLEDVEAVSVPLLHASRIAAAVQLPNGLVVTAGDDGRLVQWDPDDLEARALEIGRHDLPVKSITVLPDGRVASTGNDEVIKIWTGDGTLPLELIGHRSVVESLAALPDGRLVSSSFDGTVRIWDISDPDTLAQTSSELGLPGRMTLLDDGYLAIAVGNGWIEAAVPAK